MSWNVVAMSSHFNVVYRGEDCHCSFPTLSGGKGVPYSSDAISYFFHLTNITR